MESNGLNNVTENAQQQAGQVINNLSGMAAGDEIVRAGLAELEREKRLNELLPLMVTTDTDVPPEQPIMSRNGTGFFAIDDIHAVKGKQKQGKTTLLKMCLATLMKGEFLQLKRELPEPPTVLYLDTEQKMSDVKLILSDVVKMTGLPEQFINEHIRMFYLRKRTYKTLKQDLEDCICHFKPQVVFVDGIVEFVQSFNDEELSREVIRMLLRLCEEHHCSIINVLHTNKSRDDDNMRGHLGTELGHESGTVLECEKSETGIIKVSSSDTRHGDIEPFFIYYDGHGNICDGDNLVATNQQRDKAEAARKREEENAKKRQQDKAAVLEVITKHDGQYTRANVVDAFEGQRGMGRSKVQDLIKELIETDHTLFEVNSLLTVSCQQDMFPKKEGEH